MVDMNRIKTYIYCLIWGHVWLCTHSCEVGATYFCQRCPKNKYVKKYGSFITIIKK